MEKFKVALIADWYLPRVGGLELHMRDLARELNSRGHEAHIICSTAGTGPDGDEIRVHRLPVPLAPMLRTIRSPQALVPLERVLRAEGFDVVHCQSLLSPLSHAGAYLAKKLGIPSLVTEQSDLRGPPIHLFRTLDRMVPWSSWPTLLTAVSSFVAGDMRRAAGGREVHVLNNAIDPSDWQRGAPRPSAAPIVTSVLRLTKRKRPLDLIRAIPLVNERLPASRRPRFVLAGDGPERAVVEREVRRLRLGDQVELAGLCSKEEIKALLHRTTVFVMPTVQEAHCRAVLEAMAAGVPIVARKPNGVSDSVSHGNEGFLAEGIPEFAGFIAQILGSDDLQARMGEAALRRAERFSWDRSIARHVELYLLARARRGAAVAA